MTEGKAERRPKITEDRILSALSNALPHNTISKSEENAQNQETFERIKKSLRYGVSLKNTTWMRCGGDAAVVFSPKNVDDLSIFLKALDEECRESVLTLGACSNVIIRDGGIDGIVIKLGAASFGFIGKVENENEAEAEAEIKTTENEKSQASAPLFYAGGRALDSFVAKFCADSGIGGAEFLSGIPGTIGGNIKMNAGCYGACIWEIMTHFFAINTNGEIKMFTTPKCQSLSASQASSAQHAIACKLGLLNANGSKNYKKEGEPTIAQYRHNPLPNNWIFLGAVFCGKAEPTEIISERMQKIKESRENSQPIKERTSGSTFVNPEGQSAWKLIDSCGMRGLKIGDAEFSNQHCNFLINTGDATSSDLEKLCTMAQEKIAQKHGIKMQMEVKIIGSKTGEANKQ